MKEPQQQDHYRVLGLNVKATKSQIKQTFTKLAKKWHPDKVAPSKQIEATKFFQQLRDAYDTLLDTEQRKAYDAGYASIKALWDAYDRQAKVLELKKARRAKFSQSMVVLRSATEDFSVHEHIITRRSEYIQRRLEKVAADENNKRIIDMTDEEGDVICAYVNYLYEGKVDTELCHTVMAFDGDFHDSESIKQQLVFLAQLLVFGEEIGDNAFFNEVIDTLAKRIDTPTSRGDRQFPGAGPIHLIYEGTHETSPARAMLVHMYAESAREGWLSGDPDFYPKKFTCDVLRKVLKLRPPPSRTPSVYDSRMDWHKACG